MMFKRILGHIVTIVMVLLFILVAGSVILSKVSGGEPTFYGYQLKSVLSGSMEPAIHTGSIVAIKPEGDTSGFNKGDIITFRADENRLITHRIVEVVKNEQTNQVIYRTKGDSNDAPDIEPVSSVNVIGRYTGFTIPYIGYIVSFAGTKLGNVTLLIVPGLLLVFYAVITLWKAISSLEEKKQGPDGATKTT
ncbi:signal peptidase I SipW [Fontibacillus sp. BL9]|uniref:signal peptidase I SipW n=1 Tax=Fontibacillus sp. BL9 TaxID=3389971 RepID=UPI00397D105E